MAQMMVRCSGEKDDVRCQRRNRFVAPKGAELDPNQVWKCDGCVAGQKPYEPRSSARKGQQKQSKKK